MVKNSIIFKMQHIDHDQLELRPEYINMKKKKERPSLKIDPPITEPGSPSPNSGTRVPGHKSYGISVSSPVPESEPSLKSISIEISNEAEHLPCTRPQKQKPEETTSDPSKRRSSYFFYIQKFSRKTILGYLRFRCFSK